MLKTMSAAPLIDVVELVRSHRAEGRAIPVLKGVSFQVWPGEFVAIMGASGSGKSTLLNVLGLLDRFDAGRYTLAGEDTRGLDDRRAAALRNRSIGFVFQAFHLLPHKTVAENVALPLAYQGVPRRDRRTRALALLERVGLRDYAARKPSQLSGGQRQRVAIARALATDPPLILADEPTGSLDSASAHDIMDLLRELNAAHKTIVLVTHDHDVARAASRIVTVKDGLVVESAPEREGRDTPLATRLRAVEG
jgi:putative ABC transport system ATP-binding protein